MRSLQHVVAGARLASLSTEALPVVDPATGAVIASCPAGCAADVDAAVAAARAAAPVWASMPLDERGRLLCRAGERVAAASILVDTIEELDPKIPKPTENLDGIVIVINKFCVVFYTF